MPTKNSAIRADRISRPHSDKVGMDVGTITNENATVQDALTGLVV